MESKLSTMSKEEIFSVVRKHIFKNLDEFINSVSMELEIPKNLITIEHINNTADVHVKLGDVVCTIDTKVMVTE